LASPSACGRSSTGFHNIINLLTAKPNLPANSAVVADGMTVNVTLIISVERYAVVIAEWVAGLNQW
jgi:transaldolase